MSLNAVTLVVLIDDRSWDLSRDDLAEQAVSHRYSSQDRDSWDSLQVVAQPHHLPAFSPRGGADAGLLPEAELDDERSIRGQASGGRGEELAHRREAVGAAEKRHSGS